MDESTKLLAARICHEANRAICESFGDQSQVSWDSAPEWQRKSAVEGVEWRLAHLDAPASAQHDAWSASRAADGWVFGEVKDTVAKTHPCLVQYEQLSEAQKAKDAVFVAIVRTIFLTLRKW